MELNESTLVYWCKWIFIYLFIFLIRANGYLFILYKKNGYLFIEESSFPATPKTTCHDMDHTRAPTSLSVLLWMLDNNHLFFLAMDYNHLQLHVNVNASLFIDWHGNTCHLIYSSTITIYLHNFLCLPIQLQTRLYSVQVGV